jgi:hypothetical protein
MYIRHDSHNDGKKKKKKNDMQSRLRSFTMLSNVEHISRLIFKCNDMGFHCLQKRGIAYGCMQTINACAAVEAHPYQNVLVIDRNVVLQRGTVAVGVLMSMLPLG